ncbi:hypothetical protein GH714_025706 [Hevea brasiliensis]|uniref:RRM domain-containing protein n=1 Tax=Hevea brasiliensis TaxID=3981 RepID=A0A6A6KWN2_HEVBR|nr:hypothetical protein GH714_025706 [Hevea brasiliensis]
MERKCAIPENGDAAIEEEEAASVPEVVDEIPDDSQMVIGSQIVAESNAKIEEVPKKSYASIVKVMKENTAPFSSPVSSPLRSAPKSLEQVTAVVTPAVASETHISTSMLLKMGMPKRVKVLVLYFCSVFYKQIDFYTSEGPSIYVKGLPLDATPALLENEFKKFGPIRSGGIQVRSQKGFCFGFVEFEMATAVQSALQMFGMFTFACGLHEWYLSDTTIKTEDATTYYLMGQFVQLRDLVSYNQTTLKVSCMTLIFTLKVQGISFPDQKAPSKIIICHGPVYLFRLLNGPSSAGNNRGRFSGAGAGYRNEGARGRGNFGGGKAYGRGDFSNRTEFGNRNGNRGGFSNRGGDGYRRTDKMGNNGGRANRDGGLAFNAAAKTTAPRVSATA